MATVRALVLRAPGTNCDEETAYAFQLAGAQTERIHIHRVVEAPQMLDEFQILCLPGGFSYGDDIAAGRILSSLIAVKLGDRLREFRDRDHLILGICNGFQALLQTGLLLEPDPTTGRVPASLAFNHQGRFEDRWVHLAMSPGPCVFVRNEEVLTMPIAHAEGRFTVTSSEVLESLVGEGRVVTRYVDESGSPGEFPINPNGSAGDVAGICDKTGRVFGLMPHPERHMFVHQHPRWTRREVQPEEGDGLRIFRNAVAYFE